MEVLLKVGKYAGEMKDVRADAAHQMIADGRATDPRIPVEEVPAVDEIQAEVVVAQHQPSRRRGSAR